MYNISIDFYTLNPLELRTRPRYKGPYNLAHHSPAWRGSTVCTYLHVLRIDPIRNHVNLNPGEDWVWKYMYGDQYLKPL